MNINQALEAHILQVYREIEEIKSKTKKQGILSLLNILNVEAEKYYSLYKKKDTGSRPIFVKYPFT